MLLEVVVVQLFPRQEEDRAGVGRRRRVAGAAVAAVGARGATTRGAPGRLVVELQAARARRA